MKCNDWMLPGQWTRKQRGRIDQRHWRELIMDCCAKNLLFTMHLITNLHISQFLLEMSHLWHFQLNVLDLMSFLVYMCHNLQTGGERGRLLYEMDSENVSFIVFRYWDSISKIYLLRSAHFMVMLDINLERLLDVVPSLKNQIHATGQNEERQGWICILLCSFLAFSTVTKALLTGRLFGNVGVRNRSSLLP